jgi:hypothetical protein
MNRPIFGSYQSARRYSSCAYWSQYWPARIQVRLLQTCGLVEVAERIGITALDHVPAAIDGRYRSVQCPLSGMVSSLGLPKSTPSAPRVCCLEGCRRIAADMSDVSDCRSFCEDGFRYIAKDAVQKATR